MAIATANTVLMLEHSIYSVISPEGAASILWRDQSKARDAATAMKITADDLKKLSIVDEIIKEPLGGAHRAPNDVIEATGDAISFIVPAKNASGRNVLQPDGSLEAGWECRFYLGGPDRTPSHVGCRRHPGRTRHRRPRPHS